jgi:hypothetical protein
MESTSVVVMRAHFEMCYMVSKFIKKKLRAKGRPIRTERVIKNTRFSYEENPIKRIKYPVRINAYMI